MFEYMAREEGGGGGEHKGKGGTIDQGYDGRGRGYSSMGKGL